MKFVEIIFIFKVMPYFVMKIGGKIPGIPVLFICGICAAALSSVAGLINTISCCLYDDFLRIRYVQ